MDVLHIEQLLYCWRHSWCGLELHEISDSRTIALDMYQSLSDTTLFVYAASLYIHMYIDLWCTTTHDNKTHLPYDCCSGLFQFREDFRFHQDIAGRGKPR